MVTFTPVEQSAAAATTPSTPAVPDASGGKPPIKFTPVADAAPTASAPPAKRPSVLQPAKDAIKAVPKDIWHDIHSGLDTIHDAMQRAGKDAVKGNPVSLAGPEAALGAAEVAGAPVTGSLKALFGDPQRKVIPQDHVAGRMISNALDDAVLMFGPEAVGPFVNSIKTAAGPVRRLMEGGVQLTPGQLNPMFAKRFEEAARSVPLVGSFLRKAYERTLDSFNVATARRVMRPLGDIGEVKTGREALTKAHDMADARYDQIRAGIPALHNDQQYGRDIAALKLDMDEMDPTIKGRLEAVMKNRVDSKWDSLHDTMTGEKMKSLESELTKIVSAYRYHPDMKEREFAKGVDRIREALRDAVGRQYPKVGEQLKEVNAVYARLADLDIAAARRAGSGGTFTPSDLLNAIKRSDRSPRHMAFNEGARPIQEWAEDADKVIGNKLPDSGTAERAGWGVMEGGIHGGIGFLHPGYLAALGTTAGAYSRPGVKAINAAVKAAPDITREIGSFSRNAAPVANVAEQIQGQK